MSADTRFVFDTNTVVSAVCFPRSFGRRAFDHALANAVLIACDETLAEFNEVIERPKFDRLLNCTKRLELAAVYARLAMVVQITGALKVCRDPTDDKFLELAAVGKAQYIVTRDKDLLVLDPFGSVRILDAESLVAELAK